MQELQRFLLPLAALCAALSFPRVDAALEVGTFFGANWANVEEKIRTEFRSTLAAVRSHCSPDALCSIEKRRFCGYEDNLYHRFDQFAMNPGDGRHLFDPDCIFPTLAAGCFQQICFEDCFEANNDVSRQCNAALTEARNTHEFLHEVENMHDGREQFFRGAVSAIALLSAVAGVLVIILSNSAPLPHQPMDEFEERTAKCAEICIVINWISVMTLLGFVIFLCPIFLLVIVPPFLLVHALYYGLSGTCETKSSKATDMKAGGNELLTPLLSIT